MSEFETRSATDVRRLSGSRHPVNVGHLVMGLAFVGIVVVWWFVQADLVEGDGIRWLLPLPWVFAGAAGLLAVVLAGRSRSRTTHRNDADTEEPR